MTPQPLPQGQEKFRAVQSMFDRIAPKYDLMNRLITLGLDQRWRRRGLEITGVGPGDLVLDIACGTGDITELALERGARVIGLDFAGEMLRAARTRGIDTPFLRSDAGKLPLLDASVSVITCGFAMRNFVDLGGVLREMGRVLHPGGRIMVLEVHRPKNALLRAGHAFYFGRIVPLLGALISDRSAYAYLPRSVSYLPPDPEFFALFEEAGFKEVNRTSLLFGAAQMITGVRG